MGIFDLKTAKDQFLIKKISQFALLALCSLIATKLLIICTRSMISNIIEISNSPEFQDVSPKQIVPQLADQGISTEKGGNVIRGLEMHLIFPCMEMVAMLILLMLATGQRVWEFFDPSR